VKKFALITGASGGIGATTALKLASEGWNLYLHYHSNIEKMNTLVQQLEAYNIELITIQADLRTNEGVHKIIESIFQLHAIVICSGTSSYSLFTDLDENTIDDLLQIHVKSPLLLIKKLLPKLMKFHDSSIVIISSIWGQTGAACEVMYSTVKGAQISFVKALSKEMASNGLRINCVAPGAVKTSMMDRFTEEEIEEIESEIPLGRLAMPEEVSEAISFLLSSKSSYITGQTLSVNGGWYI